MTEKEFYKMFEVLRDNVLNMPKDFNSKFKVSDTKQLRPQSLLLHGNMTNLAMGFIWSQNRHNQIHTTLKRSGIYCLHG
jgi:hypothetical protein